MLEDQRNQQRIGILCASCPMCSQAAKVPWVNSEAAAEALRALASTDGDLTDEPTFVEWTGKASAVLRRIFGAASVQVGEFEAAVALKK